MPYVELADGRLWTQTEGVGDDVLLIAGLADDASSWDAQVASLSTTLILNGSWVRSDERFRSLIDSWIAAVERVASLRALIEVISLWVYPSAPREDGTVERCVTGGPDTSRLRRSPIASTNSRSHSSSGAQADPELISA